jgi:hypothetical protein
VSELKRIDPKAIPELFRKHGMRPKQRTFYCELEDGAQCCCCVNTILVADKVGLRSAITRALPLEDYVDAEILATSSGINPDYAVGLAAGWDDAEGCTAAMTEAELAGVEDGRAAWEACQEMLKEVTQ